MNRRLFLLGGLAALSACATAPVRISGPATPAYPELETLLDAEVGRQGLTCTVASRGCARREDFTFVVDRSDGRQAGLAVARRRVETCPGAAATRAAFTFSYAEIGLRPGDRFYLLNPMSEVQTSGSGPRSR